jgi:NADPH:quinone reductase-like Zn-dependent oxidoreductase
MLQILATALNPIDWKIREYGPAIFQGYDGVSINQYPIILGTDSAGVVEGVGEGVTAFKKGDRV